MLSGPACLKKLESAGKRSGDIVDYVKFSNLFNSGLTVSAMYTWVCHREELALSYWVM